MDSDNFIVVGTFGLIAIGFIVAGCIVGPVIVFLIFILSAF